MHTTLALVNVTNVFASYWGGAAEAIGHFFNAVAASYWGGAAE